MSEIEVSETGIYRGGLRKALTKKVWCYCTQIKKFCALDNNQQIDKETFNDLYDRFMIPDFGDNFEKGKIPHAASFVINNGLVPIVAALTYYPGKDKLCYDCGKICFNMWMDPCIPEIDRQIEDEEVEIITRHIDYICGNEQDSTIIKDWLAFQVQNQGQKINWAVIVYGEERGTGKSFLGYLMEAIFNGFSDNLDAMNARAITAAMLSSDFNSFSWKTQFMFVNEMYSEKGYKSDQRKLMNKLKDMVTEKREDAHPKGVDYFPVPNRYNMMLFTNHDDALAIDENERRFFVVECESKPISNENGETDIEGYYQPLWDWIEIPENIAKIKKWFMQRDLKNFKHKGAPPRTHAMKMMAISSKSDIANFMLERIQSGEWPFIGDIVSSNEVSKFINSISNQYGLGKNISPKRITTELKSIGAKMLKKKVKGNTRRVLAIRNQQRWTEENNLEEIEKQYDLWLEQNNRYVAEQPL